MLFNSLACLSYNQFWRSKGSGWAIEIKKGDLDHRGMGSKPATKLVEKEADLRIKASYFSYGEFKQEELYYNTQTENPDSKDFYKNTTF